MMYAVTAQRIVTRSNGWNSSAQVPAFYLYASSAGEAKVKASDILGTAPETHFEISVEAV